MKRIALVLSCLIGAMAFAGLLAWAEDSRPKGGPATVASDAFVSRADGTAVVYTRPVDIPTYPYAGCLLPAQTGMSGVPYRALNWTCMITAGLPVSQTYTLLVLSNDYLTVTMLPELGGRVYELIFKPTGNNELYRNPVIKPTPWGPLEQGWWLAAGGIEWGFPTDEHGYEWGEPWRYQVASGPAGVTVTIRDSDSVTRPTVAVDVRLPADRAVLEIRPQIFNPTTRSVDLKYWTNAMLAPGALNTPSADLRFLFQGDQVTVHSSDDATLPAPGELMDWPEYKGRDFSRLGDWDQWLGFFEAPQAHGPFVGVYDTAADEGILRIYPADVARGSKAYAHGWSDRLPSFVWTDDESAYVEVHGGLMPTFWDTATLASGQAVSWTEVWYPAAGVGGVSAANEHAVLSLRSVDAELALGLYTPAAHQDVELWLWGQDYAALGHWRIPRVHPAHPFRAVVQDPGWSPDGLILLAVSADGMLLGSVPQEDRLPPRVTVEPLPVFVTAPSFTVMWRGDDLWSGIQEYDIQYRAGYAGEWRDWLTRTTAISATFTGTDGQTYFFRARARDKVGNVSAFGDSEWGQAFTSVLLTPAPVLVTSHKTATPRAPAPHQLVSYTLRLSNTGNLTAFSVALTDYVPATLALVSGTLSAGEYGPVYPSGYGITWQGSLPPGGALNISYALKSTAATTMGVPLTNVVWIVADDGPPLVRRAAIVYRQYLFLPLMTKGKLWP